MKIGLLTGGGHISSFHEGMRAILERSNNHHQIFGFVESFKGLENQDYIKLNIDDIEPDKAGSLLGSPRVTVDIEKAKKTFKNLNLSSLIVMGGDDHLGEAAKLYAAGLPVVGWPKTMDNNLSETYFCLGYPTAALNAGDAIRYAHADAITNQRVHLITMFGRETDWVVAAAATYGAADIIIPGEKFVEGVDEEKYDIKFIFDKVNKVYEKNGLRFGRKFAVVAVAEGADISGLESHLREGGIDAHGNPKIEPMKLALVLKDAFKELNNGKYPIAVDSLTYAVLRNCPPVEQDKRGARLTGYKALMMVENNEFVNSVVFKENSVMTDIAPLEKVAKKRFLRPYDFIDYQNLTVNAEAFASYYDFIFRRPAPKKEQVIYRRMPKAY